MHSSSKRELWARRRAERRAKEAKEAREAKELQSGCTEIWKTDSRLTTGGAINSETAKVKRPTVLQPRVMHDH